MYKNIWIFLLRIYQSNLYRYFTEHNFASEYAYIQGKRQGITSFKWVFDDGTDMNYLPWAISQPDNDVDQDHLVMSGPESGLWHDAATYHLVSYICEKILSWKRFPCFWIFCHVCCYCVMVPLINQKSLKIPEVQSEAINRGRTDNTMSKRKGGKSETIIYKSLHDRATRTPLRTPPRYPKNRKIGKPNTLQIFGSYTTKESKLDRQNQNMLRFKR